MRPAAAPVVEVAAATTAFTLLMTAMPIRCGTWVAAGNMRAGRFSPLYQSGLGCGLMWAGDEGSPVGWRGSPPPPCIFRQYADRRPRLPTLLPRAGREPLCREKSPKPTAAPLAEHGVWDNPRAPQKNSSHGDDFGLSSLNPLHRLVCALTNPDHETQVALIQDTDTMIQRYFIFQNTGYTDTTSIYIMYSKYY
jgi:hypothetical protein